MNFPFSLAANLAWGSLLAYWLWSARQAKAVVRSEGRWQRFLLYWLPLVVATLLLGPGEWFAGSPLREAMLPHSAAVKSLGLAMIWAGVAVACWARHVLGRNWSGTVQIKQDHELIDQGPYRRIRHPIYTGLLLAFSGSAVMVGDWRGLLAVGIVLASFWRKLGLEERWLGEQFGERYSAYRLRTGALLPHWP